MAYSEGILERYGDSIVEEELRREFKERIATLTFIDDEGLKTVSAGEVARVLVDSPVEHLIGDLAENYRQFLGPDEMPGLDADDGGVVAW